MYCPSPTWGMVNISQRATVIAVNEAWQMIDLRADDDHLMPASAATSLTVSPSAMPRPFTARKAPPWTTGMCWPTAAAESWLT